MRTIKEIKQDISKKQIELQKTDNYIKFQNDIVKLNKELSEVELQIKQIYGETLFKCNEIAPKVLTVTFYKDPNKSDYLIQSKVTIMVGNSDYLTSHSILVEFTDIIENANNKIKLLVGE